MGKITDKRRYVNTKFWTDNWIVEELNPLDRYVFMYLLTNSKTNIAGVYEISLRQISFEVGIEIDTLKNMMGKLSEKVIYFDGYVIFKNSDKHQNVENPSISLGISNILEALPKNVSDLVKDYRGTSGVRVGYEKVHLDSDLDSDLDSLGDLKNRETEVFKKVFSQREVWDVVMEACGIDPKKISKSARGGYGSAVSEIRGLCESLQEIFEKAKIYSIVFSGAGITPTALAKHWGGLTTQAVEKLITSKQRDKALDGYRGDQAQEFIERERTERLLREGIIDEEGNYIKKKEIK